MLTTVLSLSLHQWGQLFSKQMLQRYIHWGEPGRGQHSILASRPSCPWFESLFQRFFQKKIQYNYANRQHTAYTLDNEKAELSWLNWPVLANGKLVVQNLLFRDKLISCSLINPRQDKKTLNANHLYWYFSYHSAEIFWVIRCSEFLVIH